MVNTISGLASFTITIYNMIAEASRDILIQNLKLIYYEKILLFTGLIFSIFILSYQKLQLLYVNGSPGKIGSPMDG